MMGFEDDTPGGLMSELKKLLPAERPPKHPRTCGRLKAHRSSRKRRKKLATASRRRNRR